jgi:hypothetical protein
VLPDEAPVLVVVDVPLTAVAEDVPPPLPSSSRSQSSMHAGSAKNAQSRRAKLVVRESMSEKTAR